jgi:hypothetical protein
MFGIFYQPFEVYRIIGRWPGGGNKKHDLQRVPHERQLVLLKDLARAGWGRLSDRIFPE